MAYSTVNIVVGVDDDPRIRESIASLVESAGFASLAFPSAEEFLRSGTLPEISCLITDVCLPGMDGIDLLRQVRSDRPELPVICISGHHDDDIKRKAVAGGAFAFLYKPFDPGDLLAAVRRALSQGQQAT